MIGLLGGTFDPIHFGHLRTALDVAEQLKLKQMRFLPLGLAVHRHQPLSSSAQRLAMIEAAIAGQPGFMVDPSELHRSGPSYMVDTLQQIRNELPDTPLCLLLGGDAFSYFLDWRQPETIIELCHLIIMGRPGYQLPAHGPLGRFTAQRCIDDPGTLATRPSGDIWMQKVTQLDISSSDIRARLAQGLSVRYLLPDSVIEIIEQQRLYGTATESCS